MKMKKLKASKKKGEQKTKNMILDHLPRVGGRKRKSVDRAGA